MENSTIDQKNNLSMNIDDPKPKKTVEERKNEIPNQNVPVSFILLNNIKSILSIIGDRGAIKTSEMFGVGRVYMELEEVINNVISEHHKKIDAEVSAKSKKSNLSEQVNVLPTVSEETNK